jgi:hypothetical protein
VLVKERFVMKKIIFLCIAMLGVICGAAKYPYKTLEEAFKAAKFDPDAKDSGYFIAASDSHSGIGDEGFPKVIVNEINAMKPEPLFLIVNGDLITNASHGFGNVPDSKQKEKAIKEFKLFKESVSSLKIPVKLTLGNHDTYPYEKDGELFRTVFVGAKVYDSFDEKGVHFILLNGAQSGDIDKDQEQWLEKDIAKIPPDKTIIIFVHQPAIGKVANERGIALTLERVLSNHRGRIWVIGGHEHCNHVATFKMKNTLLVQATITTCNAKAFGRERPGYWIYCLKNGQVCDRIFRKLGEGFRIDKKPNFAKAKPIPKPFGKLQDINWTMMIGEGDRKYLVKGRGGDVVTWWAYIKELIYKLPLKEHGGNPSNIAILGYLGKLGIKDENQVEFSSNGREWKRVKINPPENNVYLFKIPDEFKGKNDLYVRVIGKNHSCIVAGFAFCK